jgi:hypothetical protein
MPVTAVSVEGYQLTGAAPEVNEQTKAGTQEHEFNWGIMKLSYTSEDQGSEAAEEVATLMQYVGYAAKMGYGLDGSSASDYHLMTGLQNYFYFDTGAVYATRNEYTISKWDEMIYNELMNNRPVVYSGTDVNRSGHTFICDGYDGEGLYHFNWGWGGAYDGYYKLQATDPYKGDNNRLGGFITNQSALLGLQPPFASSGPVISGDEQGIVGTVFAHQVAADGETIIMHMGNKNSFTCAFKFGIGELKEDGTIKRLADTGGWDRLDQGYYHPNVNFYPATYKLGDGKHKLVPISLLKDESEWKRCKPLSLCFEVEYSGEKLVSLSEGTDVEMVAIPEVKEWQFADPTYAGMTSSANVTVANGGKVEYNGPLYMVISLQDDITTAQITHVAGSAIEPESREAVAFYPYFPTEGTWYVWVVTDMTDYNSSIGKTTVEVSALPNGDCNLQADTDNSTVVFNEDGTKVTVITTIEDVAGTGYFNSLFPTLFPIIDNFIDYNNVKAQKYISNFIIQPYGKKEVTVTFEGLDKDSQYALFYLYVNNNQAVNAGDILIDYQTTGISNPSVNLRNDEFFTLDGLKRIGKPKKKGIYLHQGKKVIIK